MKTTYTYNTSAFLKSLTSSTALVLGFFLLFTSLSHAQKGNREEHRDKIRTLKVGLFTEEMDLTPVQAEKFWPVYNEYFGKKRMIKRDIRSEMRASKQDDATDEARLAAQDEIIALKQKELDLTEAYRDRFLKVISPKQYSQMYAAEEQFNKMLLEELRKRRRQ